MQASEIRGESWMGNSMSRIALDNRQKITKIVTHLILNRAQIKVGINGSETLFTSKFIKIDRGDSSSRIGWTSKLIIEKLVPEEGNTLIQSVPEVYIEFPIKENLFRCLVKYIGISSTHPYFGFILGLPESIEIKEKRKEERITPERLELLSVRFKLGRGAKKDKVYGLNVRDSSRHGLGLLVTKKDFDLLQLVNEGDKLHDMAFFAESALIKVNGTVRHKTEIEEGRYKGCYIIGIESADLIES